MESTPNDPLRRREFSSDESDSSSQSKKPKTQECDTDFSRSFSLSPSLSSSSSEEIKDLLQTLGIEPEVNDENVPSDEENTRRNSVPLQRTKSSSSKNIPIELPYLLDKSRNELYFTLDHKGIQFPDFRIPRSLFQKLFAHQVEGVSWMASLYYRGGGLLGDDMGMGKTFTTLTCLGGLMNAGTICNALVVAPKSVLRSWEREASKVLLACVPIAMVQVMSADHSPLQRKRILTEALAA
jgi:SNF2 family DNA or RNA helicase